MKLHYYPETDSLYIDLNERVGVDSREVADGVVIDFDNAGNPVGIDIDRASEKLDLATLEAVALPVLNRCGVGGRGNFGPSSSDRHAPAPLRWAGQGHRGGRVRGGRAAAPDAPRPDTAEPARPRPDLASRRGGGATAPRGAGGSDSLDLPAGAAPLVPPILVKDRAVTEADIIAAVAADRSGDRPPGRGSDRGRVRAAGAPTDLAEAIRPDAPEIAPAIFEYRPAGQDRPARNVVAHSLIHKGDLDAAWASADEILEVSFETEMVQQVPLEPWASTADWDPAAGRLTVYATTQAIWSVRDEVARGLGLAPDRSGSSAPRSAAGSGPSSTACPTRWPACSQSRPAGPSSSS